MPTPRIDLQELLAWIGKELVDLSLTLIFLALFWKPRMRKIYKDTERFRALSDTCSEYLYQQLKMAASYFGVRRAKGIPSHMRKSVKDRIVFQLVQLVSASAQSYSLYIVIK